MLREASARRTMDAAIGNMLEKMAARKPVLMRKT
jgi:hypothetical protein